MLVCPQSNKRTRVGFRYLEDGSKERFAKRSGVSLGSISPAESVREEVVRHGQKHRLAVDSFHSGEQDHGR